MLRVMDWRGRDFSDPSWRLDVPRIPSNEADLDESVSALIEQVRTGGSDALRRQAERFDGVGPESLRVAPETIEAATEQLEQPLREAIEMSIARVREATALQVPPRQSRELAPGAQITQRFVPVDRAGVYVPGGKAVYPSSVVMNVVAAQVAGVSSIALASPPQQQWGGSVHPTILATAALLGVDEVYAMGGAGAVAAMAYGVPNIGLEPVAVITGPGNQYVATAKRLVKGIVGIDSEAGPTEIVVIADSGAPDDFIAADLVSQAEHDELAQAILITDDWALAQRVIERVVDRAATTAHHARVEAALSGEQSAVIVVDSIDQAVIVSDELAPEHLEIMTERADQVAESIRHAGAIFVGPFTPVSAGDYLAGSNHVLPTGGAAKFQSGLSAMTFLRPQQIVHYDQDGLDGIRSPLDVFARAEDLPAHAEAVHARWRATEKEG